MNTTLQELDLGSNAIMDSGFLVVVNALGKCSLVKLLCRVNQIGQRYAVFCIELTHMVPQASWACKGSPPQSQSCIACANCTCGATISHQAGVCCSRARSAECFCSFGLQMSYLQKRVRRCQHYGFFDDFRSMHPRNKEGDERVLVQSEIRFFTIISIQHSLKELYQTPTTSHLCSIRDQC